MLNAGAVVCFCAQKSTVQVLFSQWDLYRLMASVKKKIEHANQFRFDGSLCAMD